MSKKKVIIAHDFFNSEPSIDSAFNYMLKLNKSSFSSMIFKEFINYLSGKFNTVDEETKELIKNRMNELNEKIKKLDNKKNKPKVYKNDLNQLFFNEFIDT